MSDDELNALFAEKVCGWEFAPGYPQKLARNKRLGLDWGYINDRGGVPDYLNDANAVLPWLEKWRRDDPDYRTAVLAATPDGWQVELRDIDRTNVLIAEATLARAAVLALLAAHNVTLPAGTERSEG